MRKIIFISCLGKFPSFGLHCADWNIMNKDETNTISTQVPTSMEELSSFGILGENIERENGKRPIKSIGRLSSWKISKNILILMAQSA